MSRSFARFQSLCTLSSLAEARPTLVRGPGGRRLVCIRRGDTVDVLDDECPHEGHPLSMGLVRGNVLTCPWHNWRFDTRDGHCIVGEESVRRHPSEVVHGEVFVAIDQDEHELERHRRDLARAIETGSLDGAVRSALRVARASSPWHAIAALLRDALRWSHTGPGELLSVGRAAWELHDGSVLSLAECLALVAVAAIDARRGRKIVGEPPPIRCVEHDVGEVLMALAEERASDAEALALGLDPDCDVALVGRAWLTPWLATKLWDGGALFARVEDALWLAAIAQREGDGMLARSILAAVLRSATFAVAESDLPGWRTTRQALLDLRSVRANGTGAIEDEPALVANLLGSEAQALAAVRREIAAGTSLAALQRVLARAAIERLARYDTRWSRRVTVHPMCAIDVGISTRMTRAMLESGSTSRASVAFVLMAAGLLGKQRRTSGDGPFALDEGASLEDLRALVRRGCLRAGTMRGEGAPLAAALWALAVRDSSLVALCVSAARRAFIDDEPTDLERIAQVATLRVSRDGTVKTRPGALP